jgi:chemosensory pili system protein ChpA (sensor histidine kinase/response regulator)
MELLRRLTTLDSLLPDAANWNTLAVRWPGTTARCSIPYRAPLKDDLLRVKEALDLFLRQEGCRPGATGCAG